MLVQGKNSSCSPDLNFSETSEKRQDLHLKEWAEVYSPRSLHRWYSRVTNGCWHLQFRTSGVVGTSVSYLVCSKSKVSLFYFLDLGGLMWHSALSGICISSRLFFQLHHPEETLPLMNSGIPDTSGLQLVRPASLIFGGLNYSMLEIVDKIPLNPQERISIYETL